MRRRCSASGGEPRVVVAHDAAQIQTAELLAHRVEQVLALDGDALHGHLVLLDGFVHQLELVAQAFELGLFRAERVAHGFELALGLAELGVSQLGALARGHARFAGEHDARGGLAVADRRFERFFAQLGWRALRAR